MQDIHISVRKRLKRQLTQLAATNRPKDSLTGSLSIDPHQPGSGDQTQKRLRKRTELWAADRPVCSAEWTPLRFCTVAQPRAIRFRGLYVPTRAQVTTPSRMRR